MDVIEVAQCLITRSAFKDKRVKNCKDMRYFCSYYPMVSYSHTDREVCQDGDRFKLSNNFMA